MEAEGLKEQVIQYWMLYSTQLLLFINWFLQSFMLFFHWVSGGRSITRIFFFFFILLAETSVSFTIQFFFLTRRHVWCGSYAQLTWWKRMLNMLGVLLQAFQLFAEDFIHHDWKTTLAGKAVWPTPETTRRTIHTDERGCLRLKKADPSKRFPCPSRHFPLSGICFPISIYRVWTWFCRPQFLKIQGPTLGELQISVAEPLCHSIFSCQWYFFEGSLLFNKLREPSNCSCPNLSRDINQRPNSIKKRLDLLKKPHSR